MPRSQDDTGEFRPGQMAQIIVPTDTKGVNIVRGVGIWGRATSDHCEVIYEDVRVPGRQHRSGASARATRPPRTASAPGASSTA